MDARGKVNCYLPWGWYGEPIYTINLSVGITPYMHLIDDKAYTSCSYQLRCPTQITIKYGWYRPSLAEYNRLPGDFKEYIRRGGLICGVIEEIEPLKDDPVEPGWRYEFHQFVEAYYLT